MNLEAESHSLDLKPGFCQRRIDRVTLKQWFAEKAEHNLPRQSERMKDGLKGSNTM